MKSGTVVTLCITPTKGGAMKEVREVLAVAGKGLEGDRYFYGCGSFNRADGGMRHVTLMNARFVRSSPFMYKETRRNIFTDGIELMRLIGKEFKIGDAVMRGVAYCYPCNKPSESFKRSLSFADTFEDRGGLIAEIIKGGAVHAGSEIVRLS